MNCVYFVQIHASDNLFCSNSFPIWELSVKFASQICHENTNTPLDGTYFADFGIDINTVYTYVHRSGCVCTFFIVACIKFAVDGGANGLQNFFIASSAWGRDERR